MCDTVVGVVLAGGASRRMGRPKAVLDVDGEALAAHPIAALRDGGAEAVALVGGDPAWAARLGVHRVADRWPGEGPLGGLASALLATVDAGRSTDDNADGDVSAQNLHRIGAEYADRGAKPQNLHRIGADDTDRGTPRWSATVRSGSDLVVVVVACDQPEVTGNLVASLVAALRAAPPTVGSAVPVTADGRRHPFPSAWRASAAGALDTLVASGSRRAVDAFSVTGTVEVPTGSAPLADLDTPADVAAWHRRWGRGRGR